MIRRTATGFALSMVPAAAMAEGTMPQMDFQNPLTAWQVLWMAVILVVLYLVLARWGLPKIGQVLALRAQSIEADLQAAQAAKVAADKAVAEFNATMRQARAKAQADVEAAEADAKAKAFADAKALNDKLDAQLEYSERQITEARAAALAAIKPVAAETAGAMVERLTGLPAASAELEPQIDAAIAARNAA